MKVGKYTLSDQEERLARRHDIGPQRIMVAEDWMAVTQQSYKMKPLGQIAMVNAKPCGKCGCTIRTRRGHCLNCRPISLHYIKLHDNSGWIYLAWSESIQRAKIGTSNAASDREVSLCRQGYGGATDWTIVRKRWEPGSAGDREHAIRNAVSFNCRTAGHAALNRVDCATARETFVIKLATALRRWDALLKKEAA